MELLNTPKWKRFVSDRGIDTVQKAEAFLETFIIPSYEKFGFGFYLIENKVDRNQLGICGLIRREGLASVDIGYGLLPRHEGHGFAVEAAQVILDYGFTVHQLNRILAVTDPKNIRSIDLLKKLGMQYDKMIKLPHDDTDLMLFEITNTKRGPNEIA